MGIGKVLVVSIGTTAAALTAAMPVCAARIVDEWRPGLAESALGGDLTVDGYGVSGLGMYAVRLDDGGTALAVCVQADVGHSASAEYVAGPAATITPELDYLLWRYASATHPATNEQAAAINVLSWWYAGAQRRGGGSVWRDPTGTTVEVDVVGVGRLAAVEAAVVALRDEATRRRGPWTLTDLAVVDGVARVRLSGPGGAVSGVTVALTSGGQTLDVVTDSDGWASTAMTAVDVLTARAQGPGPTIPLTAPGSQRLVIAGPPIAIETSVVVPPPPTTTSSTTTTTTTTTPRRPRPRRRPRRGADHDSGADHDDAAPTPTTVPATLPRTGDGSRTLARLGAVAFAAGGLLVLLAAPRFSPAADAQRVGGARRRQTWRRSRRTTGQRR